MVSGSAIHIDDLPLELRQGAEVIKISDEWESTFRKWVGYCGIPTNISVFINFHRVSSRFF